MVREAQAGVVIFLRRGKGKHGCTASIPRNYHGCVRQSMAGSDDLNYSAACMPNDCVSFGCVANGFV